MAYNSFFPATYNPGYNPYYQQQMQNMQQMGQQQPMTAPTIHADIVQVDNEQAGTNYPVGAGESQMMITKDEGIIMIKTATKNGQMLLDIYDKRPPEPEKPAFNPADYVRKDEIKDFISAALATKTKEEVEDA